MTLETFLPGKRKINSLKGKCSHILEDHYDQIIEQSLINIE